MIWDMIVGEPFFLTICFGIEPCGKPLEKEVSDDSLSNEVSGPGSPCKEFCSTTAVSLWLEDNHQMVL